LWEIADLMQFPIYAFIVMTLLATHISKTYGNLPALKDVNLKIEQGKIVFIVGESGSGKSTLVKIIAGLLNPDGENSAIYLNQEKLFPTIEKLIAGYPKIKILQQNSPLLPNHTVYENLRIPLRSFTNTYQEKRIRKLLKMCNLEKVAERFPRELSGGQLQRIALAQTLADEPLLLLLDEPFSHLDILTKSKIRKEVFLILQKHQISTLCVTHDPEEALQFADAIIVLKNGKIAQQGSPETIYQKPATEYVASLFGNANLVSKAFSKKYWNIEQKACIRTENIQVSAKKTTFEGVLIEQRYLGRAYELEIELEGEYFKVFSKEKQSQTIVYLTISEANVYFFD